MAGKLTPVFCPRTRAFPLPPCVPLLLCKDRDAYVTAPEAVRSAGHLGVPRLIFRYSSDILRWSPSRGPHHISGARSANGHSNGSGGMIFAGKGRFSVVDPRAGRNWPAGPVPRSLLIRASPPSFGGWRSGCECWLVRLWCGESGGRALYWSEPGPCLACRRIPHID